MGESAGIVERTFGFSVRVVKLCRWLDTGGRCSRVIVNQLLKAGTSIGANVEEAQASQSRADFISKMSIAHKESREALYWLRLLAASELVSDKRVEPLRDEATAIAKIIASILVSTKSRKRNPGQPQ